MVCQKKSQNRMGLCIDLILLGIVLAFGGCATPVDTRPSHSETLLPDQDDNMGGSFLESSDIRTMANAMCTQLLSLPEVDAADEAIRIATDKIRNSTRYMIDSDILLRRLRLELNNYSQGRIRFFAQRIGQNTRQRIIEERGQTDVKALIDEVADYIAASDVIQKADEPVLVAVEPVTNTNLVNINGDSFVSMLRASLKEKAGSKVMFTRPGSTTVAPYTLTGEFFAQSMRLEGTANMARDLQDAQENPERWYDSNSTSQSNTVYGNQVNLDRDRRTNRIGPNTTYGAINPSLMNNPNVTKTFTAMLINQDDIAVVEKTVDLDKQIKSGQETAKYVLSGEIKSLSKGGGGERSDYILVSFILIDPGTNEILWEYGYEVKKRTTRSVLYK